MHVAKERREPGSQHSIAGVGRYRIPDTLHCDCRGKHICCRVPCRTLPLSSLCFGGEEAVIDLIIDLLAWRTDPSAKARHAPGRARPSVSFAP